MKIIQKVLQWVSIHKSWVFSGLGTTMIVALFTSKINNNTFNVKSEASEFNIMNDIVVLFKVEDIANVLDKGEKNNNQKENGVNIEINGTVERDIIGIIDGDVYEEKHEKNIYNYYINNKIVMSSTSYLNYLESIVSENVVFYEYGDFDGNNKCEMFAIVGEKESYYDYNDTMIGTIWYVDQNGAVELESCKIEYWSSPFKFTIKGYTFIAFARVTGMGSYTSLWGLIDEEPYELSFSGKMYGLVINEFEEIEVTQSTYDLTYLKEDDLTLGHTWKQYYLYFDGDDGFKEYGGIEIEVDDISKIPICQEIIKEINNKSCKIDSIYYRENGIININISKENDSNIYYYNITLRYNDGKWNILSRKEGDRNYDYNCGVYLNAYLPSIATFPDKFPY